MKRAATWQSRIYRRDDVALHYLRTGGSKPPLVLLHGLGASGACWAPVARMLQERFDVLMPDARGHGKSSASRTAYRYEDHAADVAALIRDLNLDAPILLGHSMGGMTAALATATLGGGIRGLILADPTFLAPEFQRKVYESDVREQHRRMRRLSKAMLQAELQARHPHRSPEIIELLAQAKRETRLRAFDVLTPPNPNYEELIREIKAPIVLMIAERGVVSHDIARHLHRTARRLRIEQMNGVGHGMQYDDPERFANIVLSAMT